MLFNLKALKILLPSIALVSMSLWFIQPALAQGINSENSGASNEAKAQKPSSLNPVRTSSKDGIFSDAIGPDKQLTLQVLDEREQAASGIEVELISSFESVAKGGKTEKKTALTDKNGIVVFDNLSPALRYSHRVVAKASGGFFATEVFRMRPKGALFARLHIYPSTKILGEALVGTMGFIYVSQREDVLKVEVLFRIINVGKNAWLPDKVFLRLPTGYHGVEVPNTQGQRFKRSPEGVELEGTYGPGQHDLSFSFLLHRKNRAHQSIELPLLPNLADLRVMTDAIAKVELSVPSFPEPELRDNPSGKGKVLFTQRQMKPGQQALSSVIIDLDGLPTRGPERWVATILALLIATIGIGISIANRKKYFSSQKEKDEARQLLLKELLVLEQAKLSEEVGPRAYRQARQELLVALARLEDIETSGDRGTIAPKLSNFENK